MKYYLRMKETAIPWLGKIPEHWEKKPLFTVLKERKEKNRGNRVSNLLSLSYGRIVEKDINSNDGLLPESFETYQIVENKNIVLRLTDLQNDQRSLRVGQVRAETGIITSAYVCLEGVSIDKDYAFALLFSLDLQKVFYGLGNGVRQSMGFEDLKRLPLPLPPIDEQRAIAAYLDKTTAKIDGMIAAQEKLIELLAEKRKSLISHVIIKGLNPKAKLKDSGISWLGMIPEHWEAKRLKYTIKGRLKYGANESAEIDDPGLPRYVRITDIDDKGKLRQETFRSLPIEIAKDYFLEDGDVLFARSGATSGKTFLYRLEWGTCAYAGYLIRARLDKTRIDPQFLRHFTDSAPYWQWLESSLIQATIQNVSAEKYADLVLPMPPIEEQRTIAEYLDEATAKLDTLAAKAEEAIALMKERRSALISAVVTGKVKVS